MGYVSVSGDMGKLLVVIVFFSLHNKNCDTVVVYVVDDAVVGSDVAGIGNIVTADQSLRMPSYQPP